MGTKEDKSNEYSKNKIPIGRPFVEHLADIVICFYLHNPYGKKKKKINKRYGSIEPKYLNKNIPYNLGQIS